MGYGLRGLSREGKGGSQWLHPLYGPGHQESQGTQALFLQFPGRRQGHPALAWRLSSPPLVAPRPPALHHLSPGSQGKHWLLSQGTKGRLNQ